MSEFAPNQSGIDYQALITGGEVLPGAIEKAKTFLELAKAKIQAILQSKFPAKESAEIDETQAEAQVLSEAVLEKISERLGSNPGGWYEHQETHEKYYVKYYDKPDRARVEFIANAIYAQLGVPAAKSELFETDDGRLAIAAKEIPGTEAASGEKMRASEDVRSGFLADAYLANWDVVGLVNDNIVQGADGRMHRIDNGGALVYRAQGGLKNFSGSEIPELQTMLNPEYSAGKVFSELSQEEMREQAQLLVNKIDDAFIDQLIDQAGLSGETAEQVREGLKGRLQVVKETFGVEKEAKANPWQEVTERLRENAEKVKGAEFRGHTDIAIDKDKIEGQRLDIIDARDLGYYSVYFKLTNDQYNQMVKKMQKMSEAYGSSIAYSLKNSWGDTTDVVVAQAWTIETGDIETRIAMPSSQKDNDKGKERSAIGLIEVKIKTTEELTPEMIEEKMREVFEKLEMQDALASPDEDAEKKYKIARFAWQHKIDEAGLSKEDIASIEARLERREVFPGYTTMVEPGKSKEYMETIPFAVHHSLYDGATIVKIMMAGGLIATQERFRRGSGETGMSSAEDMNTGGADSVFTRLVAQHDSDFPIGGNAEIIFNPEILDRTDWYAYDVDKYGSTSPKYFPSRLSPKEIFDKAKTQSLQENNEQMFRYGIPVEEMLAIAVNKNVYAETALLNIFRETNPDFTPARLTELIHQGPAAIKAECESLGIELYTAEATIASDHRLRLLDVLEGAGITEINGVPVSEFIVETATRKDMIQITQDKLGQKNK